MEQAEIDGKVVTDNALASLVRALRPVARSHVPNGAFARGYEREDELARQGKVVFGV